MSTSHSSTRSFYGAVRAAGDDLGEHFCELTADPYRPRDMQLVVHLSDQSPVHVWNLWGEALTVEGPNVDVVTLSGAGGHSGKGSPRLTARVETVVTTDFAREGGPPSVYRYGYSFPLTSTTQGTGATRQDGRAGFIRSRRLPTDEDGRVTFEPVAFLDATLDGVDLQVGSGFDFAQGGAARYPEQTLTRVSVLSFDLPPALDGSAPHSLARGTVDTALRLLSVLERDRLRWVTEGWHSKTIGGDPLHQQKTVRWTSPPRERTRLDPYRNTHGQAFQSLIQAYDALDAETRGTVDKMCDEFQIAATAGDLETSLVRWHSVIDFACKRSEQARGEDARRKTKRRIIDTCAAMGVDLEPLVGQEALESPNKGELSFTALRNQFVHEGFDVFEDAWDEVVDGVHAARALAERMLLAVLGLPAPLAHLGTAGLPH